MRRCCVPFGSLAHRWFLSALGANFFHECQQVTLRSFQDLACRWSHSVTAQSVSPMLFMNTSSSSAAFQRCSYEGEQTNGYGQPSGDAFAVPWRADFGAVDRAGAYSGDEEDVFGYGGRRLPRKLRVKWQNRWSSSPISRCRQLGAYLYDCGCASHVSGQHRGIRFCVVCCSYVVTMSKSLALPFRLVVTCGGAAVSVKDAHQEALDITGAPPSTRNGEKCLFETHCEKLVPFFFLFCACSAMLLGNGCLPS